jgi:adenine-specific DNA-methyltransferase
MPLAPALNSVEIKRRKDNGVFYTDKAVVNFLVRWGLSQIKGIVMDPSCGDGRFLISAASHGAEQVIGCDLDPRAVNAARSTLSSGHAAATVYEGDFFALDPTLHPKVDLVVGNPPFIRYQQFAGDSRRRALQSALTLGVRLTALSSAWAPFVIHALRFLRPGGAMAMVVPAEIVQTNYGLQTLDALCRNFAHVHLLAFARNFFSDAQADTYLLLAAGAGHSCRSVELHPLESIQQLADVQMSGLASTTLPVGATERAPFALAFLKPKERDAWHQAIATPGVFRLSDLGTITNGYVTGANDFFLMTREAAIEQGLPTSWLRPTVVNAASLRGPEFTASDIAELEAAGKPHHLLNPPTAALLDIHGRQFGSFVRRGEAQGIHRRFKCRTRRPWWHVPGLHVPHLFLPYMVGREPIASVNAAGATYTNTIHGLRLRHAATARSVGIGLHSTLTLLSMELHGRTYGGGILKLEPSETQRVHVAVPTGSDAAKEVDRLLRSDDYLGAVAVADDVVLQGELGLSTTVITRLRSARDRLVSRRYSRSQGRRIR